MAKDKPKKTGGSTEANSRRFLIQNPRKMAGRDVKLAIKPQLQALKRDQGNVRDDYGEYQNQLRFMYDLVGQNLGTIGQDLKGQLNPLDNQYANQSAGMLEALGLGQSTAPDAAEFANSLGAQALAGQRALGTMSSDAFQNNASARRQGEYERLTTGRRAMGEMQDELDTLRERKHDIKALRPEMIQQRVDELRQLAWEQWMAEREFRLRTASARDDQKGWDAFYEWMASQQKPRNPNRPNGGNGNGGRGTGNTAVDPNGPENAGR